MKHPQHELLIAAANDVDARFECSDFSDKNILSVLYHPHCKWKLIDKFAELKKAYAEGKTIQYRYFTRDSSSLAHVWYEWKNVIGKPCWDKHYEYRIKPEPVYEWQWLIRHKGTGRYKTSDFYTTEPIMPHFITIYRLEDSKREVKS